MKRACACLILLVVLGMATASKAASQASPAPPPQSPIGESAGEFKFFLAGVRMPERRVGFFKESGASMAYGCDNCSFVVGEFGIANAQMDLGPGIIFNLSQDGALLTATCKSTVCFITTSEEAVASSRSSFSANLRSLKNSETLNMSTKARVLFTVKK
jgi:hypothetical protein